MSTFCCPKSIKACAVRFTRLNDCGVTLDPLVPNSRIEMKAFTSLNLSPDLEDGEDITLKNACGDICVRNKDQDRLKGLDIEMTLCGIPLPAMEMLLGATLLAQDDDPTSFKGAVLPESKLTAPPDPIMVELWSKNAEIGSCTIDGVTQNLYVQWLLPFVTNWQITGDLNFEDGPLEVQLVGYAENNPLWFPSYPGADFPSYDPGSGDPDGTPTGGSPPVLPAGVTADTWSLDDQDAIQAGGPLAWQCVAALPGQVNDCDYVTSSEGS